MIILPKEDEYSVCPISAKSEQEESSNLYVSSRTANNEEEFYPSIPGLEFEVIPSAEKATKEILREHREWYNWDIVSTLDMTSDGYQMPIVQKYMGTIPRSLIGYDRLSSIVPSYVCPHFFEDDYKHIEAWYRPKEVLYRISRYRCVIGPEFSMRMDMPLPQKSDASFMGKALTAWWQRILGPNRIIPNLGWADEENIDMALSGYPIGSIVAINSLGIGRDKRSIQNWRVGYERVLEVLRPQKILRMGRMIEGERKDISIYYPNDNHVACTCGWEWRERKTECPTSAKVGQEE